MARRGDDDDNWIEEVADTLAGLGLFDEHTTAALIESMRDVVQRDALDDQLEADDEDDDQPGPVTVLSGGRSADQAPTPRLAPALRVVQSEDDEDDDEPIAVRVLRLDRRDSLIGRNGMSEGRIAVSGGDDAWQTVLYGARARTYRISCETGDIEVAADGDLVVRVLSGQSCDVEGAVIRVRSGRELGATGRYERLLDPPF